jgi:hypothetical protein
VRGLIAALAAGLFHIQLSHILFSLWILILSFFENRENDRLKRLCEYWIWTRPAAEAALVI